MSASTRGHPSVELGLSPMVEIGLLGMGLGAGLLAIACAVRIEDAPSTAGLLASLSGGLLFARTVIDSVAVWQWEPGPDPSLQGMRTGELGGNVLWLLLAVVFWVQGARIESRARPRSGPTAS